MYAAVSSVWGRRVSLVFECARAQVRIQNRTILSTVVALLCGGPIKVEGREIASRVGGSKCRLEQRRCDSRLQAQMWENAH